MDLVIKISDRCNFACKFCSSNMIAVDHNDLELSKVADFLEKNDVKHIIVNGGDPLCVSPEWYYELIKWLGEHNKENTNISFTTNLYDFWLHPDKWEDLFKNWVSVCTSFQYGTDRCLANGMVYSEDMFRQVFKLFEERIGYKLKFIAVINDANERFALDHVRLAKELGTTCRINPALKSGRTTKPYSFAKMMKIWLDVIEEGLADYEENCELIYNAWKDKLGECPFASPMCHSYIKCMSPDGTIHNCPSIADDILLGTDAFYLEKGDKIPWSDTAVRNNCYNCRWFKLCNSCTKRVMDFHTLTYEELELHCQMMNDLLERAGVLFNEYGKNKNVD